MKKVQHLYIDLDGYFQTIDSSPVVSVHGIRKRTKHMRALLNINPEPTQQAIVILKNISRILSPYRDAKVMVDTFRHFSVSKIHRNDPVVEEFLVNNPFYEDPQPDMIERNTLNDLMAQLVIEINSIKPEIDDTQFDEWLDASRSSTSRQLKRAQSTRDTETVHTWRKGVKEGWYLLRFKHGEDISDPEHAVNQYDQLGKLLGEVHDIDTLMDFILSHFKKYPKEPMLQYRNEILNRAFAAGEDIFF